MTYEKKKRYKYLESKSKSRMYRSLLLKVSFTVLMLVEKRLKFIAKIQHVASSIAVNVIIF